MRIETVTLAGFRCFGPDPIMVPILPEVTTVVGPNAVSVSARFDEEAIKVNDGDGVSRESGSAKATTAVDRDAVEW
ncbi:hypothetical protein ACU4GI_12655 [Cupriavidus basilensis]